MSEALSLNSNKPIFNITTKLDNNTRNCLIEKKTEVDAIYNKVKELKDNQWENKDKYLEDNVLQNVSSLSKELKQIDITLQTLPRTTIRSIEQLIFDFIENVQEIYFSNNNHTNKLDNQFITLSVNYDRLISYLKYFK